MKHSTEETYYNECSNSFRKTSLELLGKFLDGLLCFDVGSVEVVDGHLELRDLGLVLFLQSGDLGLHASLNIGEGSGESVDLELEVLAKSFHFLCKGNVFKRAEKVFKQLTNFKLLKTSYFEYYLRK